MKINTELNLTFPVVRADGSTVHIHVTPISDEVFETYFRPISKTLAALMQDGMGLAIGPRIAGMMLKDTALEMGRWDGADGVRDGLLPELRRMISVVAPSKAGWHPYPFDVAVAQGLLDASDVRAVEGVSTFFMFASAVYGRKEAAPLLSAAAPFWSAQTTSFGCTDFTGSLKTSIVPEPISPPPVHRSAGSSVPL